jgi:hypothetical protein
MLAKTELNDKCKKLIALGYSPRFIIGTLCALITMGKSESEILERMNELLGEKNARCIQ